MEALKNIVLTQICNLGEFDFIAAALSGHLTLTLNWYLGLLQTSHQEEGWLSPPLSE